MRTNSNKLDAGLYDQVYKQMEAKGYLTFKDIGTMLGIKEKLHTEDIKTNFDVLEMYIYDSELTLILPKTTRSEVKVQFLPILRPCSTIPWDKMEQARRRA